MSNGIGLSNVILFREVTPSQTVDDSQYVLIVGDPAYTDNFDVYGPFDSYESASSWLGYLDTFAMVKKLRDPHGLRDNQRNVKSEEKTN